MGSTYLYGKIVSLLGGRMFKGKKGPNQIFRYMLMMKLFGGGAGKNNNGNNSMENMLPLLLMGNSDMGNLFDGIFDEEDEDGGLPGTADDNDI